MRKYLILTHGKFADGIAQTLSLFIGEDHPFNSISAYVDDVSVDDQIERFMTSIGDNDELIILSDLLGGSVNQKVIPYLKRSNTHIIAGFNLATLLQLSTMNTESLLSKDDINNLIQETRTSVVYVNDYFASMQINEDDE